VILLVVSYLAFTVGVEYLPPAFGEKTMQEVAQLRSLHRVSDRRRVVLKPPAEPEQLTLLN
jgi:hypothetical protein